MEEFGPVLHHIKGEDNIVADNLSRLGMLHNDSNKAEIRYNYRGPKKIDSRGVTQQQTHT